ncbi:MAG: hypothetical protein ACR2M0_12860 [Chloroflexia bacterium]
MPAYDWQTQLAVAMCYAKQMGADPVLTWVHAGPTTANWAKDEQTVPVLDTAFFFADARNSSQTALATTFVHFTNPPITGTISTDPTIAWDTVPITGYVQQRLSMRDAFVTMKLGPQDVYRMTAQEGLAFLGSYHTKESSLSLGVLDVQEYHLDQFIPVEKRQRVPLLVWIAMYSKDTQSLRFIIDPYTGEVLVRDTPSN